MKEKVFVSIVTYVYNDELEIRSYMKLLDLYMQGHFENYELLFVNDNSSDGSLKAIRDAAETINGNVTLLNLSRIHGTELAMLAGLHKSIGDFIFEIDKVDSNFPVELIGNLYRTATEKGSDIVSAVPEKQKLSSKLFYKLINRLSYLKELGLTTEKVRIVSRRSLNAMLGLKEKIRYRKALYALTGFTKAKILYKNHSTSSRSLRKDITQGLEILVSFSNIGLKVSHLLSLLFLLFSIFMIAYSIYNYLFNKNIVEGWTTIMIMLSTGFSGVFLIIGLMGEYIARILTEVQDRPFYSTKSVEIYKAKKKDSTNVDIKIQRSVS